MFAVGMCLMLLFATPMQSYAMEADGYAVSPRFTYIYSYTLDFNVTGGNANITARLVGNSDVTDCNIKCNLEKLTGSTYWMQIQSFSASGTRIANLDASYGVSSGTYRVMGIFRCNTETQTVYSSNVTY